MSAFSLAEVARLAGLEESRVRSLVAASILEPEGPDGKWQFSFRDLVLCRSARGLVDARVPLARLIGSLREVKARLPEAQPLSGVGLSAEGRRVVAHDGSICWEVDSGQVRFEFEGPPVPDGPPIVNLGPVLEPENVEISDSSIMTALEWFDLGLELEGKHPDQARDAYRRALELDPLDAEARLNIARLLRRTGLVEAAEAHYRLGSDLHPEDARPMFHLGLLMEGQGRWWDAVAAYEQASHRAPRSADVYRRLAGLYERVGESAQALRALKTYRALTEPTK